MQIKSTVKYHLIPVRMAIIKKTKQVLARTWRTGNPVHGSWECKVMQPLWEQHGGCSEISTRATVQSSHLPSVDVSKGNEVSVLT